MNDLPTRLRRWTHDVDAAPASDLMDEAAAEIERLRWRVKTLESAATYADAMLRERSRTGQKIAQCDSFCAVCPERDNTNHDAAPAAKANVESVAPQPTAGDRSGNPTSHSGTGKQPAPHQHAKPPQGSVQGEGSFCVSQNAKEPVAWWLKGSEYDTGCEYEYVSLVQESAEAAAKEGGTVTPLYAHPQPTLTDEERDAVERAIKTLDGWQQTGGYHSAIEDDADTLRKLLERLA